MGTEETKIIRQELTQWLQDLNDPSLLNLLNSIKLSETNAKSDWWDDLTEKQQENIQLGVEDLNDGRTISSKEFWKRLNTDE